MSERADSGDARTATRGPRLVLALYALLVGVTGVGGALVPVFVEDLSAPALFGLFPMPITPLGFAVYGALTVAVVLGVPLLLVVYVSQYVDDPDSVEKR